jgi:anthranilate synthase/aminodeoxychorismate synthase-like glutamine amidotransferase
VCLAVIRNFYRSIPILGVCLGHECIAEVFGATIIHARKILHGKTAQIIHTGTGLFAGLSSPIVAARYNSLVIDRVPAGFDLAAWDSRKEIMAISHSRFPVYGLQFHPESFMTSAGEAIMRNFLLITRCLH